MEKNGENLGKMFRKMEKHQYSPFLYRKIYIYANNYAKFLHKKEKKKSGEVTLRSCWH
jgi:hypothetical protein